MPFTIHEEAAKKQFFLSISRPQEQVPDVLPQDWKGTPNQGLPVKQIPHFEYPRVVYKHPLRPFREIEHRNDNFELVGTEKVPTEHLTQAIACEAHIKSGGPKDCTDCKKLLESALAEGWLLQPYIPEAPAKPDADLYASVSKKNLLEERKDKK
jgi:hypothetical protein